MVKKGGGIYYGAVFYLTTVGVDSPTLGPFVCVTRPKAGPRDCKLPLWEIFH
jgi:hypothetical protein